MRGIELAPEHPVSTVVDHGVAAERAGFDTVFASGHYNNRDPFVVLDRIAARTERVRVGPGVANPYETHPVSLSSRVATLQETSDGRAVFGIGAGDRSTLANLGYEREQPLRRVLETMVVARSLWAGDRVSHDGVFSVDDAGLNYDVEGEIPVYVGAQGPHMIRMSAKHADGVLLNASHPLDVEWAADQIEIGLADRPAERGSFDVVAYASVSLAADEAAALEAARPPVAFIAAGAPREVLDRHGIDPTLTAEIGDLLGAGAYREAFTAVTESMIEAFCVAGTPATVIDRLLEISPFVDGFVVGSPLGPTLDEAIPLAGSVLDEVSRE